MTQTFEILYVGDHYAEAEKRISAKGGVLFGVGSVYEGIAQLKRNGYQAAVVDFDALGPDTEEALNALRHAAEGRPVLVSCTSEEWDLARAREILDPDEILLRPFYPEELWRRLSRAALPPEHAFVGRMKSDARRLAALMEDIQLLNRFTNDMITLAEQCVEVARTRMRAGRVSLFLRGGDGLMHIVHAVGLKPKALEQASFALGEGVAGSLAKQRQPVLVQEAGKDGPASDERGYDRDSYMIVPLVHMGDVLGVLCITHRIEPGPFATEDLDYISSFANAAAQTVHNAIQYRAVDELATIDELTGLFNRRYFNRMLAQEVERARRYKHDLTLAMIDVDFFKRFNDANGHQEGDRALQVIAEILRDSFRESDVVVRYGGEEFVVIMPETTRLPGNGVDFVDRARVNIEAAGLNYEHRGVEYSLTISGGVATFPSQADNAEALVRRADEMQFEAKRTGRNRIKGA